jgi:hypothetical protein
VTFDESNGSQGEQVDGVVGMEESPSKALSGLQKLNPQLHIKMNLRLNKKLTNTT